MTRTVITGVGVVSPAGVGAAPHWEAALRGELNVRPIEAFSAQRYGATLAGQVPDFPVGRFVDDRIRVQTDRWTWFAMAAAELAFADAAYRPGEHDPYRTSVMLAAGLGGVEFGQREIEALWRRGRRAVSAYQSIAWFYAASTGQLSIHHGAKGPSGVLVSDGAGGLDSIGAARRAIRRGTPTVLAGGVEAPLCPYALACTATSGRLTGHAEPRAGYKPFDVAANGYAPAEGGALLVVEDAEAAARRGARVYGEVAGYAATHDAHHHEDPAPDGRRYAAAMRRAIEDAGLTPDDVDVVVADGAGSPDLDRLEADALHRVFGERTSRVPVTAPQGLTGRSCSGGAALNVAAALLAIRDGVVPAVGNLDEPSPEYGLDLVHGKPRRMPVRTALVNARGHGGFNAAVVIRAYAADPEEQGDTDG
jgi:minimal PKS chain-length factor (CLF/KS beta)